MIAYEGQIFRLQTKVFVAQDGIGDSKCIKQNL